MSVDAEHTTTGRASVDEYVCLRGWPPVDQFVRMMTCRAGNGDGVDAARLAAEWGVAQTTVRRLEHEAPYPTDAPDLREPSGDVARDVAQLARDPLFTSSFGVVRTTIQFVPLDRLIVFQRFINLSYATTLVDPFSRNATEHALFRACLSLREPLPQVQHLRSDDTFLFVSESTDLRLLPLSVQTTDKSASSPGFGRESAIVTVPVGFGSNCVNAVLAGNRLVLVNGSHRAYAAMASGRYEIPCVIQHVDDAAILPMIAPQGLVEYHGLYFESQRPPLLRDFLDERLAVKARFPKRKRCLKVTILTEEFDIPT